VTAAVKRAFGVLIAAVLLAGSVGFLTAAPARAAGSAPVPGAGGTVGVLGEHFVRYCVKHFKPNSNVTVTNETTGATVTIHTNSKGAGCTEVPIKRACKAMTERITATGIGLDGNPATVHSTITVPATKSLCQGNSSSGGTLPFTGSNFIIPGLIIGIALVVVGVALNSVRRRRDTALI
jgi:hypothetical protein